MHTFYMVTKNDKPLAVFLKRGELVEWLKINKKGWYFWHIWKLPNGNAPIFQPIDVSVEFLTA